MFLFYSKQYFIPGFCFSHFEQVGWTPTQNWILMLRLMMPDPHQEGV